MNKIVSGSEARDRMIKGIKVLNDAVSRSLGGGGQTSMYPETIVTPEGRSISRPSVTKDGITIASYVQVEDPVGQMGIDYIKSASRATDNRAGDGTTTSTLLAYTLLKNALGTDFKLYRDFNRGLEDALKDVTEYIDSIKTPQSTDVYYNVALTSSNGDEDLSKFIADSYTKVGVHGFVTPVPNDNGTQTHVDIIEGGAVIETGLLDPKFVNKEDINIVEYNDPIIFLSLCTIPDAAYINSILEKASDEDRPLLIVAEHETEVAQAILHNKINNKQKWNIIRPPSNFHVRREIMEDLACLFGCELHGDHVGDAEEFLDNKYLGTCTKYRSVPSRTVFFTDTKPQERIEYLKNRIEKETHKGAKENLNKRLALLDGGFATIYVGAPDRLELTERMHRAIDAVNSVKSAQKDGIIPGGGIALLNAQRSIGKKDGDTDYDKGYNTLIDTISAPYNKILENAELDSPEEMKFRNDGFGVNAVTGELVNMIEEGIVDPTATTKEALRNSVSVSKTILTTGVAIYDDGE